MEVLVLCSSRSGWIAHRRACWPAALALAALTACGSHGSSDSGSADATPDSLAGSMVTVQTGRPPALVAFREEASSAWQQVAPTTSSTFHIALPSGPYRVAVVCESPGTFPGISITEYARTPDDDPMITNQCLIAGVPTGFHVSGTMRQAGEIALGVFFSASTSTNWAFDLLARSGTFDLLMLSRSFTNDFDGIAIRRDLQVTGDLHLGTIDLSTMGTQPLAPMSFTGNLLPGEVKESSVTFQGGGTTLSFGDTRFTVPPAGSEWTVKLAPASVLRTTDHQFVSLTANVDASDTTQSSFRSIRREVHLGDPTSVTLPDPIGPVLFQTSPDRLTATWSKLPDQDDISLLREAFPGGLSPIVTYRLELSARFVVATGATTATLDFTDLPGFKAAWLQDPAVGQFRSFTAGHSSPTGDSTIVGVSETIDPVTTAVRGALPAGFEGRRASQVVGRAGVPPLAALVGPLGRR